MHKISSLFLRSIGAVFLFTLAMIYVPSSSFALSSEDARAFKQPLRGNREKTESCCGKRQCKIKKGKSA